MAPLPFCASRHSQHHGVAHHRNARRPRVRLLVRPPRRLRRPWPASCSAPACRSASGRWKACLARLDQACSLFFPPPLRDPTGVPAVVSARVRRGGRRAVRLPSCSTGIMSRTCTSCSGADGRGDLDGPGARSFFWAQTDRYEDSLRGCQRENLRVINWTDVRLPEEEEQQH
ncbi:hypothetical protein VTO42DRAFT_8880 [Malbranchea cinnamomea]